MRSNKSCREHAVGDPAGRSSYAKSKRQAKIAGLNKFLRIYYARVSEVYKA